MDQIVSIIKRYLNRHLILEISPGIIFFIVNKSWGIKLAIVALIIAVVISVALGLLLEKKTPVFPIVGLTLVLVLGLLTLLSGNEDFIKLKPTIGKVLFAVIVGAGMLLRPSLLARALDGQVYLTELGWKVLALRWILIALVFAALNELTWRNFDTDTWIAFKAFVMPLSIISYIAITSYTANKYWDEHSKLGQE